MEDIYVNIMSSFDFKTWFQEYWVLLLVVTLLIMWKYKLLGIRSGYLSKGPYDDVCAEYTSVGPYDMSNQCNNFDVLG